MRLLLQNVKGLTFLGTHGIVVIYMVATSVVSELNVYFCIAEIDLPLIPNFIFYFVCVSSIAQKVVLIFVKFGRGHGAP